MGMSILEQHPNTRQRLSTYLLSIPLLANVEGHSLLTDFLPKYVRDNLTPSQNPPTNIGNIIKVCDEWQPAGDAMHPLYILIGRAIDLAQGHLAGKELTQLQDELQQPPAPFICPYPGARPLTKEDRLYGREAMLLDQLERVSNWQYLLVKGRSGAGKTSFVEAGLLPGLSTYFQQVSQELSIVRLRPSENIEAPWLLLENRLATIAEPWVLFVDQLEELFRLGQNKETQTQFFNKLVQFQNQPNRKIILAINEEQIRDLKETALWARVQDSQITIEPLQEAQLRKAIEQPAQDLGVTTEPELMRLLLKDVADQPELMPLLQMALRMLWGQMAYKMLLLNHYKHKDHDKLNPQQRLEWALGQVGNDVFAILRPDQRLIARWLLQTLPSSVKIGPNIQFFRLPHPIKELLNEQDEPLITPPNLDEAQLREVIRILKDARLLMTWDNGSEEWVDLAHDALINHWDTLIELLKARSAAEEAQSYWERRAASWIRKGFQQKDLLSHAALPDAEKWLHSRGKTFDYTMRLLLWLRVSHIALRLPPSMRVSPPSVVQNSEER